jgi:hypothetical protein
MHAMHPDVARSLADERRRDLDLRVRESDRRQAARSARHHPAPARRQPALRPALGRRLGESLVSIGMRLQGAR